MASTNYWAVIPAAGVGTRMMSVMPKQYMPLYGKTVIEHSLTCLISHPRITGAVVAVAPHDDYAERLFKALPKYDKPFISVPGGAQRTHSVLNALLELAYHAQPDDWVLVHDAVRPCLRHSDIDLLIATLSNHAHGGILGLKVNDTVKRTTPSGEVLDTVDREHLWYAQTPQMFRLAPLTKALTQVVEKNIQVTDEAAAMELNGIVPIMVEGRTDNIKITRMPDLILAQFYLEQQALTP